MYVEGLRESERKKKKSVLGCEKRQIIFIWSNAKYDGDIQQVTIGNLHVTVANLLQ